eukprot:gene16603-18935_t
MKVTLSGWQMDFVLVALKALEAETQRCTKSPHTHHLLQSLDHAQPAIHYNNWSRLRHQHHSPFHLRTTLPLHHLQNPHISIHQRRKHLDPADKSDPVGGAGAANRLTLDSKTFPELDISYFFTPNLAAELVLTYPQKHDVLLDGKSIGTMKHLPPTLLAQYHFLPNAQLRPYVGAGLNYTTMSKVHLLNGNAGLEHKSFGLALQAGADFALDKNWSHLLNGNAGRERKRVGR